MKLAIFVLVFLLAFPSLSYADWYIYQPPTVIYQQQLVPSYVTPGRYIEVVPQVQYVVPRVQYVVPVVPDRHLIPGRPLLNALRSF